MSLLLSIYLILDKLKSSSPLAQVLCLCLITYVSAYFLPWPVWKIQLLQSVRRLANLHLQYKKSIFWTPYQRSGNGNSPLGSRGEALFIMGWAVATALSIEKKISQNGRFSLKMHFAWRKSATKFLCVKTVSGQSCKAFIGLTNRAKIIGGGDPLYLKFGIKVTALVWNRRFSIYFRS